MSDPNTDLHGRLHQRRLRLESRHIFLNLSKYPLPVATDNQTRFREEVDMAVVGGISRKCLGFSHYMALTDAWRRNISLNYCDA